MKRKLFSILSFIVLISLPSLAALLHQGFYSSHDGIHLIIRLADFHRSLRDGQFPVRFLSNINHGFGYPVLNFAYPGIIYFWEFLHLLFKTSLLDSVRIGLICATILSAFFMFLYLYKRFNLYPSLFGAILYLYMPYRFLDLYVRGSYGEITAFVFFPLIFLLGDEITKDNNLKKVGLLALSISGLILSHNSLALIFLALFFSFFGLKIITSPKNILRNLAKVIFSFLLGLLLSAFFILPAIFELKFTRFYQAKFANFFDEFITMRDLLEWRWGYESPRYLSGAMSFQLGIIPSIFLGLAIVYFFRSVLNRKVDPFFSFNLGAALVVIFLMLPESKAFWQKTSLPPLIQFPWRLMALELFLLPILSSHLMSKIRPGLQKVFFVFFVAASILLVLPYAQPKDYNFPNTDDYFFTNESSTTSSDEYQPVWVKEPPKTRVFPKIEVKSEKTQIYNLLTRSNQYEFGVISDSEAKIRLNTVYFPGWKAYLDGQPWQIDFENAGLIDLRVPSGNHSVRIEFRETGFRLFADYLSLIGLAVTFYLLIYNGTI